jgi:hypothetical protein
MFGTRYARIETLVRVGLEKEAELFSETIQLILIFKYFF